MNKGIKGLLQSIVRRNSSSLRRRGQVIQRFAKKIGLIYFGTVDQRTDDHDVVRGLTVSTTHQDSHYAVGSYDSYDVSIVDRFDGILDLKGTSVAHNWLILQIDLQGDEIFPHTFLKPIGHSIDSYNKLFQAFHHLSPINSMLLSAHSPDFHSRYELFASSSHAAVIEELLQPIITNTIAARFWPHAVEVFEGKMYVYTTDAVLTATILESALESALWLARVIDKSED